MTSHDPQEIPDDVRHALADGRKVTYGPVSLRPPREPGGRGGNGQYRLEWRCPVTGARKQASARRLEDAWQRAHEQAVMISAGLGTGVTSRARAGTLGAIVDAYLDPGLHPAWSENRRKTVTSLLRCWVASPAITVIVANQHVPAAELPTDLLTPAVAEQILAHVHTQRAQRTYRDVHRELRTMLRWATRERLLDASDLVDRIPLARPVTPTPTGASNQVIVPVDPDEIPTMAAIDRLREAARATDGDAGALIIDVMAFGGLRIGEALAMASDATSLPYDDVEGVYRPYVWRRVHRTRKDVRPPKHHRNRHAWLPPWMTDQVAAVAAQRPDQLFPGPKDTWWPVDSFRRTRMDHWLEAANWPKLPPTDPRQRVWQWTAHSLRHHAASWMLNDLGLAPDDVASFLGHASGHQIWVMYSRVQSGLSARATRLAAEAGDPRDTPGL